MGISISIKSEIDSRVILYPLMRCLKPLGNILIVTSNRNVSRLIDNEIDGDFRNFHIVVDTYGGVDELLRDIGISPREYTYVVYDNVGVVSQDKLIIPIGPIISEEFETEMMYLGEDKDTHILRFGRPVKKKEPKPDRSVKKTPEERKAEREAARAASEAKRGSKNKRHMTDDEIEEAARKKFQPKKEDITVKLKKLPNLNFPSFEDIELFESDKRFFNVDKNFVKFFYTVFQDYIGVKEPNYMREVTRRDARSSSFNQKPASGENSIKLNVGKRVP